MGVPKKEKIILYALGNYYDSASKGVNSSLMPSFSKSVFIDLLMKTKLVNKQQRALYKNLESLEKRKIISYKNKNLKLTDKGQKIFNRVHNDVSGYIKISNCINSETVTKAKKLQTVFRM